MLSIIIPTLNEEKYIKKTLSNICNQKGNYNYEIIVVDAQSTDNTIELAKKYSKVEILLSDKKSRAYQMNLGAEKTKGDILLFLHADTLLPENAFEEIEKILKNKNIVAGGFKGKFKSEKGKIIHYLDIGYFFLWFFRIILGDQAMFVRKSVFNKVNGYPEIEIMEEFDFCRKLRKHGKLTLSNKTVTPSSRRFKQGFIKTNAIFLIITLLYYLKVSPNKLKNLYKDIR